MTDGPTENGAKVQATLVDNGVDAPLADLCAAHFDHMVRWNRVHNLTRITSPQDAAISHYLDCIRATECVQSHIKTTAPELETVSFWADVGSGAGFPGVIVAAMGQRVHLIEPAKKRASFLQDVSRRLQLDAKVQPIRVQQMDPSSVVVSRATLPWRSAKDAFDRVAPQGLLALMVSDDASESAWSAVAQEWGATHIASSSYQLPGAITRSVLFARAPSAC